MAGVLPKTAVRTASARGTVLCALAVALAVIRPHAVRRSICGRWAWPGSGHLQPGAAAVHHRQPAAGRHHR